MNKDINIKSDPNGVVLGSKGDLFFRENDRFFIVHSSTGKTDRLDFPPASFMGQYSSPLYKGRPVVFTTVSETWVKATGNKTKKGWKFLVSDDPYGGPVVVVPPQMTPTPTEYPVMSMTPTPTPTPTEYPVPTPTI